MRRSPSLSFEPWAPPLPHPHPALRVLGAWGAVRRWGICRGSKMSHLTLSPALSSDLQTSVCHRLRFTPSPLAAGDVTSSSPPTSNN